MKVANRLNAKLYKLIIKSMLQDNMSFYILYFFFIFVNIIKIMRISPRLIKLLLTNRLLLFNLCYYAFLQDNGLLRIEKLNEDNTALISFKISPSANLILKVDIYYFSIFTSFPYRMLKEIFKRTVKKGHIVVDVGAFIGGYTYMFSELVGSKGKVYAFEPVPYLFNILGFHCDLFNLKNVLTENKAVSDHEGYLKLILSEGNVQDNRLAYTENTNKYVLINTTSLDKYFEKQSVLPDIVKIDAQCADYKVIKGMINLIKKKNLVIFCEFEPKAIRRCGDDPLEFLKFISNLGFKIFEIDKKIIVLIISII